MGRYFRAVEPGTRVRRNSVILKGVRAVTSSEIDPQGIGRWAVLAEWYGEERVIFRGDAYACVQFVARTEAT